MIRHTGKVLITALTLLALLLLALLLVAACTTHPPLQKTARFVDQNRFSGQWYVISNIPYFAEKGKVASKTTYRHRGPNLFDDIFESRDKTFDSEPKKIVGKVKSLNSQNTQWQSTFYWIITSRFEVLDVDENYQTMVLGHKSRNYGWVMARSKIISDKEYTRAMQVFASNGYKLSRFSKVPQLPEQIGLPGFQISDQ